MAGYYSLLEMERTNAPVIAGRAGDRLTKGLQAIIEKYNLPFVAYNQGSIVHLETSGVMLLDFRNPLRLARELKPRKHMMEEMGAAYMSQGLITLAGSRMYTSMADTDEVIDEALRQSSKTVLGSVAYKVKEHHGEQLQTLRLSLGGAGGFHVHQPHHPDVVDHIRAHHRTCGKVLRRDRPADRFPGDVVHDRLHPAFHSRFVGDRHLRISDSRSALARC